MNNVFNFVTVQRIAFLGLLKKREIQFLFFVIGNTKFAADFKESYINDWVSSDPFFTRSVSFALQFLLTQAKKGSLDNTNRVIRNITITVKMIIKLIISFFHKDI